MRIRWLSPAIVLVLVLSLMSIWRSRLLRVNISVPLVRRSTTFYAMQATSLEAFVREFRQRAGTGDVPLSLGRTNWNFEMVVVPKYGMQTTCTTAPLSIRVVLSTRLPRAVNSAQFTPEDSAEWQRFLPALTRHEAQHDSIVVATTTAFLREVEQAAARGTPTTSIARCASELDRRVDRANAELDARTFHGGRDGAALRVVRSRRPND